MLGGGAFTGAVYQIGALRALDLLAVNRSVTELDVYVGTSAGALVASLVANGVTPDEMMRVVNRQGPMPFRDIHLGQLLRPNVGEVVRRGLGLPARTVRLIGELAPAVRQVSLMEIVLGLLESLPSGVYSGSGLEGYLQDVLAQGGRTDDFRELNGELYLAATDVDTCERIVFGADGWDDVPISTAVRASTALPMLYTPARVRGRDLIDGGVISTTNLDIAVEAGAKFIVVVNPLVPYINDQALAGDPEGGRRVSDLGLPGVGYQAFKLMAYQRLHEMATHWGERYPGVDIVLLEPEPDDEIMFQTSVMNYTKRVEIARHGFASVTLKLAEDYEAFKAICDRHGIEISADRVRQVVQHAAKEQERTGAWRRILEQTTSTLLQQSGSAS